MFQINQMQTTTLQKNLQKEKKIHKKILPLFLSHVLLLLFILATLFVHKKVREKRFLIANTQSMQTAKNCISYLEVDNETHVYLRLCRHLLCRVKNES